MKCVNAISSIRYFILSNDIINEENKMIVFVHKTLMSRTIHGGLGDSDDELQILLSSEGWKIKRYTHEYGQYANMGQFNKIYDERVKHVTDEELEAYFNGSESSLYDVIQFYKSSEKVLKEHDDSSLVNRPKLFWYE